MIDVDTLRVPLVRCDAEISDDADDLIPRGVRGARAVLLRDVAVSNAPADRVGAAEHEPRERLVHDDRPGARPQVAGVKRAAGDDRRVEDLEEIERDPGLR